jgi:hypothetical protein
MNHPVLILSETTWKYDEMRERYVCDELGRWFLKSELLKMGAKPVTTTCQSYYDDDNKLRDCTCGKCGKFDLKKTLKLAKKLREFDEAKVPSQEIAAIEERIGSENLLFADGSIFRQAVMEWLDKNYTQLSERLSKLEAHD